MARTKGGLIKRNYQFTDEQIARIAEVARERHISEAAAVREMVDLGYLVMQEAKRGTGALREIAVRSVAKDVAREVA